MRKRLTAALLCLCMMLTLLPGTAYAAVGDAQAAKEQAEEYGHPYARELNYLTVHGVLHCLGYDHETEEEQREMREQEEAIMQRMGLSR